MAEEMVRSALGQTVRCRIRYSCFVEKTETDNPASTFHLEAERWLGNISLWKSGACNLESIKTDVLLAEPIFEHRQIQSEQNLHTLLSQVFHL